ncbi:MAG: NifU family protein [Bacteroidota bacterium]|nr:NifU family protein [Bacteroidota bacterium]
MKKTNNILENIEVALDTIRPYLESDGGNVRLVEITQDKIVKIQFLGACEQCSVNFMTLENGIETAIKELVPDIKKVVRV